MTANIGADYGENTDGVVLFGQTISVRVLGIALGVVGLMGAGYLLFSFVLPLSQKISSAKAGIETKKASIATKDSQVKQKANIPQQAALAKERSEIVTSLLPNPDTMDTLLIDLNKLIKSNSASPVQLSGNLLESFSPTPLGALIPEGKYRTQTLNIQFASTYADLISILRSIESLRTLVVVQDLQLAKKATVTLQNPGRLTPEQQKLQIDKLPPILTTSFKLVAFIPATDAEIQALAVVPKPVK